LAPHYLELELTESVLMEDAASTSAMLGALKAEGYSWRSMILAPAFQV
jgi:hypothetical protein